MRFGSVCSGIEAASVAWHPLGWKAAWLSEIEPFPSAVLAHHYPDVPNLGDMTTLPDRIMSGEVEAPDLFCGGTPCQAFSVAGLRNSLDDARGNLSLTFCEIANAIDTVRAGRNEPAAIIFWENVPGVLSTKDNAFGCFLAGLAGEDNPLEPPGGKWTNAGYVLGPKRAIAWRLLDAQYFGVAQRRKRVFVVASARNDFNPAAVLFEFDGVRRDSAPSREAGQNSAASTGASAESSGCGSVGVTIHGTDKTAKVASYTDIAGCLRADVPGRIENSSTTVVQQPIAFAQNQRDEVRIMQVAGALAAEPGAKQQTYLAQPIIGGVDYENNAHGPDDVTGPLLKGSPTGGGRPLPAIAYEVAQPYTLAIRGRGDCHNLEYRQDGTSNALLTPNGGRGGIGVGAVAQPIGWSEELTASIDIAGTIQRGGSGGRHDGVMQTNMAVRRLTPVECERLQGFPDNYTNIPWRKKDESPDGPRYKALGNSWATPVVSWIGRRIQEHLEGKL
jgi:DNA (cytosine-5)-methyltransferase 1